MSNDDQPAHYGFDYWLKIIASIGKFETGGKRAPYKPLLLLWLIGRVVNGEGGVVTFREAQGELRELLSPHRVGASAPKPEHPYVYLGTTSEIWSVRDSAGNDIGKMSRPLHGKSQPALADVSFLKDEATGVLATRFVTALGEPELRDAIVNELLKAESTLNNGILLCTQHHRLFDAGALGLRAVSGKRKILVSQRLQAGDDLVSLSGQEIRPPQRGYDPPAEEHVEWHYENLFAQPERQLA